MDFLKFYNKLKIKDKNFWFVRKYIPDKYKNIYDHIKKYCAWVHMIQEKPKNIIKEVNLVEDGRSVIKTDLIKKFRKNKEFMKLFKSGILFDSLLSYYSNYKKIYIVNFIYYIHNEIYNDKKNENKEAKIIFNYTKKDNNLKNFKILWPDLIKVKYIKYDF